MSVLARSEPGTINIGRLNPRQDITTDEAGARLTPEPSASAPPPKSGVPRTLKQVGFGAGGFKGLVPDSDPR